MDNQNTKEINLMDIFTAIGKWLRKIIVGFIKYIGKLLQLSFRHKILIICVLLVSVIIGQYLSRPSARKYKVEGMCQLNGVNAPTVMETGKQLSFSSPLFLSTSLARKLNIPDSVAKKVAAIELFPVIDYQHNGVPDLVDFNRNHSLNDSMNVLMKNYVYIRIKMIGTDHAQEVGNAVLNYINSNEKAKKDFNVKRAQLIERINMCDMELARIDSLANITYFKDKKPEIKFENNKLLLGNSEIQLFYKNLLELLDTKAIAQTKLEDAVKPIVNPAGFIINPSPVNSRLKYGVYSLVFGLVLGLIFGFIIENRKKWLNFLKTNDKI